MPLGLPPISSDPPVHTWSRRLLLPWFSHRARRPVRGPHPRALPTARRRHRRTRSRRCRRRVRPADPRPRHRRHARRARRPRRHVHRVGPRRARVRPRRGAASTRPHRDPDVPDPGDRGPQDEPGRRPHQRPAARRGGRRTRSRLPRPRHRRAHVDRRRRHHVELDRRRRCGTSPPTPTTAGASSPSRSCCPTAIEELLRAYSPVTMGRIVAEDVEVAGCPMKAGDRVLLNFPAANRDPDAFADADTVIIDRDAEPPCGVRPRHPPLRRLEPRPHGTARRDRGVARRDPRVPTRGRRRGHLGRRPGPRTAHHPGGRRMRIRVDPDQSGGHSRTNRRAADVAITCSRRTTHPQRDGGAQAWHTTIWSPAAQLTGDRRPPAPPTRPTPQPHITESGPA